MPNEEEYKMGSDHSFLEFCLLAAEALKPTDGTSNAKSK